MKVLIISSSFPLSEDEVISSFIFDEAIRLNRKGVDVSVVRGKYSKNFTVDGMHIKHLQSINLSTIHFGLRSLSIFPLTSYLRPLKLFYYLNYGKTIVDIAKKYDADLIHAHFACPEGFAARLTKRDIKKPLLVTLHGYDILTESTVNYGIRRWKYYADQVKAVFEAADVLFVASRAMYNETLRAGCDPEKVIYIPNGTDINRFNPNLNGREIRKKHGVEDRPIVFTLRRLVPKNGIEYFVRSAVEVVQYFPDVVFVVGGSGPLRQSLEKLAKELGLSKNIIFTGEITSTELPYYYSACDVFVIPSVMEAFGLVTIEAMATGKPVIGTRVGGILDIIENGKNGFLVNLKDPKSLADKIIFLLKNSDLRRKLGIKSRKIVEEKFNIEKRINKILEIYSEFADLEVESK